MRQNLSDINGETVCVPFGPSPVHQKGEFVGERAKEKKQKSTLMTANNIQRRTGGAKKEGEKEGVGQIKLGPQLIQGWFTLQKNLKVIKKE